MSSQLLIGFMPEPNCGRGTVSIIWSCLVTISLCVYTAIHFNVPNEEVLGKIFIWPIEWIVIGILAPEVITVCAVQEFLTAREILKQMHCQGMSNATYVEAYLLGMGGLQVHTKTGPFKTVRWDTAQEVLKSEQLRLNFPSRQQIKSRVRAESVAKVLTVGQFLWFLIQVIGRHAQGYDVSLIEVSTISYIILICICYLIWFKKPYCISEKITIEAHDVHVPMSGETDDLGSGLDSSGFRVTEVLIFVLFIFSGIHCLAWNYQFPSVAETWLWRVSSLVCIPTCFIANRLFVPKESNGPWWRYCGWFAVGLYVVARLTLIVLAFTTFRAAPASIYASVNWAHYISFIH